ncbi:hypothetical protein FBU59_000187 [Linderina macrospora]|uniref:Uncharacterized protein n=1 Tax=Linderina macrospora TaxID=4868 RepID=A0ACC1JHW7_9FUNG|nr:hypothetical protein FBU59_000187 [Linderina macrospora]
MCFRFVTTTYPIPDTTTHPHGTHSLKRTVDLRHHHKMHVVCFHLIPLVTEIHKAMIEIIKVMYPMVSLFPRLLETVEAGEFLPAISTTDCRPALPCIVCPAVKYVVLSFGWDNVPQSSTKEDLDTKVSVLFTMVSSCFPNAKLQLRVDDSDEHLEDSAKMLLIQSIFDSWGSGHLLMHRSSKVKPNILFPHGLTGLTKLHVHAHPLSDQHFFLMHRCSSSLTDLSLSGLYPFDTKNVTLLRSYESVLYPNLRRLVITYIPLTSNRFPRAPLAFAECLPKLEYFHVTSPVWPIPEYMVGAASKYLKELVIEYPRRTNRFRHTNGGIIAAYQKCPSLERVVIRQNLATEPFCSKAMYQQVIDNLFRYPKSMRLFHLCSDHIISPFSAERSLSKFTPSPTLQSFYAPEVTLSIHSVFTLLSGLSSLHDMTIRFALPTATILKSVTANHIAEMVDMCKDCCAPLKNLTLTNNHYKQKRLLFSYVLMIAVVTGTLEQATVHVTSKTDDIMDVFVSEARRGVFTRYREDLDTALAIRIGDINDYCYPIEVAVETSF